MVEDPQVDVLDRASVAVARDVARRAAAAQGFSEPDAERLALATSELAQNQLDHAGTGIITVRCVSRAGVPGLEIVAADAGPGIPDLAGVLDGRVRGRGLGAGLQAVRRVASELDADVRLGEGCTLRIRRFAAPVPRHPEVAVLGRGVEAVSGDHAVVLRADDTLLLAALDGAGHGIEARRAADAAAREVRLDRSPAASLLAMHAALEGSRGASASLVRCDLGRGRVGVAGVGNVQVQTATPGATATAFRVHPGLLGGRRLAPTEHSAPFVPRSMWLLCTDGVSGRPDVSALAARSAVAIASEVFRSSVKAHDDALIVVAR